MPSGVVLLTGRFIAVKHARSAMKASCIIARTSLHATVLVAAGVVLIVLPSARIALMNPLGVASHRVTVLQVVASGAEAQRTVGALTRALSAVPTTLKGAMTRHNALKAMVSGALTRQLKQHIVLILAMHARLTSHGVA